MILEITKFQELDPTRVCKYFPHNVNIDVMCNIIMSKFEELNNHHFLVSEYSSKNLLPLGVIQ